MSVRVLSVDPGSGAGLFTVTLEFGCGKTEVFQITVQEGKLAGHDMYVTCGQPDLARQVPNSGTRRNLYALVSEVRQGKTIELPALLGEA